MYCVTLLQKIIFNFLGINMSKLDDEKMFNLLMFKMYVTNAERDKIMPWVALVVIVACVSIFLLCKFGIV